MGNGGTGAFRVSFLELFIRVKTKFPLSLNHRKAGFSLIEMLLTLVLILGLVTASVMNFTGAFHRTGLDEGSERLVTMIRFAQAEAATSGRKVRLSFEIPENQEGENSQAELRDIQVLWEPDVLGQPGRFEALSRKSWNDGSINELVGVHSVRALTDTGLSVVSHEADDMDVDVMADEAGFEAENRAAGWFGDSDEAMVQSNAVETPRSQQLTFYPDGSSDAMEIVLASRKPEDSRLIAVRVQGVLGTVSRQEVDPGADGLPRETMPIDGDRNKGGNPSFPEPQPGRTGAPSAPSDNWAELLLGDLGPATPTGNDLAEGSLVVVRRGR